jgi:hypothetical protein
MQIFSVIIVYEEAGSSFLLKAIKGSKNCPMAMFVPLKSFGKVLPQVISSAEGKLISLRGRE